MQKRWLIVGPSWVGDMVMAQSLFKRLKADQPNCLIDVVAPAWSLPILARMPEVRQGIALDVAHGEWGWDKRRALGQQLRGQYTHAIVIPRSLKSSLVPFFAEVPERVGYRGEMRYWLINDMRLLDKRRLPLTVQRFVALGLEPSLQAPEIIPPQLQVDAENQQRCLQEYDLSIAQPVLALLPGAEFGPAKQWPVACWIALADYFASQGWQIWCLGSPKDHDIAEEIVAACQQPDALHNLCGKTRLEDAIDLLALANYAVSNDSGLMHVAAAVSCPLVAIYRTTTPEFTPPLTEQAIVLRADLHGRSELMGVRTLPDDHGITDVPAEQVIAAISEARQD